MLSLSEAEVGVSEWVDLEIGSRNRYCSPAEY